MIEETISAEEKAILENDTVPMPVEQPAAPVEPSGELYQKYGKSMDDIYNETETSKLFGAPPPAEDETVSLSDKIRKWKDTAPENKAANDLIQGAAGGAAIAIEETANFALDTADFLDKELSQAGYGSGDNITENRFEHYKKRFENPTSTAEHVGKIIGQYVGPFAAVSKISKAATIMGQAKNIALSSGISGLIIDPEEKRLADLVQSNPSLANPLVQMLASEKGDSKFESRIKNMIESAVVDTSLLAGFKLGSLVYKGTESMIAARKAKIAQQADPTMTKVMDEKVKVTQLLDEEKLAASEAKINKEIAGETPKTELKYDMDPELAKHIGANPDMSKREILKRLKRFETLSPEQQKNITSGTNKFDDVVTYQDELANLRATILDKYTGDVTTISEVRDKFKASGIEPTYEDLYKTAKRGRITDVENQELAKTIFDEDYQRVVANLNAKFGDVVPQEDIRAMAMDVAASRLELENVLRGTKSAKDLDPAEMAVVMERIDYMQASRARTEANVAEAARNMRDKRMRDSAFKNGDASRRSKMVDEYLKVHGGTQSAEETIDGLIRILNEKIPLNDVLEHQAKTLGQKVSDAAYEVWVNGVLSSFKTMFGTNIMANTGMMKQMGNEVLFAEQMGKLVGNGVVKGEHVALVHGMRDAYAEAAYGAAKVLKQGPSAPAKLKSTLSLQRKSALSSQTLGLDPLSHSGKFADTLAHIVNIPTTVLSAQDTFFSTIMQRGRQGQLAHRKAIKEGLTVGTKDYDNYVTHLKNKPSQGMIEEADRFAKEGTMMSELGPEQGFGLGAVAVTGENIDAIRTAMNKIPTGRFYSAFMKVGANVADRAIQRTPISFLRPDTRRNIFGANVATAQEEMAKMTLGTGIMAAAGGLAFGGMVTGAGPSEPKAKKALKGSGFQEYSLKLGSGGYVPLAEFGAIGEVMKIGADIADLISRTDDGSDDLSSELIAAGSGIITRAMSPEQLGSGVPKFMELIKAVSDGESDPVGLWFKDYVKTTKGFVPFSGALRDVKQLRGLPNVDTRPDQGAGWISTNWQTIRNEWMATAGIFGYGDMPPELNIFGEEVHSPIGIGGSIKSAIFSNDFDNNDPAIKEIVRLEMTGSMFHTESTNEEHLALRMPERTKRKGIGIGGGTTVPISLDPKQYHDYVKLSAGLKVDNLSTGLPPLKDYVRKVVSSNAYKSLSDDAKKVELKEIFSKYKSTAWQVIQTQPNIMDEFAEKREKRIDSRLGNKGGNTIFGRGAN